MLRASIDGMRDFLFLPQHVSGHFITIAGHHDYDRHSRFCGCRSVCLCHPGVVYRYDWHTLFPLFSRLACRTLAFAPHATWTPAAAWPVRCHLSLQLCPLLACAAHWTYSRVFPHLRLPDLACTGFILKAYKVMKIVMIYCMLTFRQLQILQ